jgi:hypothetical protein
VVVACNLVTGVSDLQVADGVTSSAPDAGASDSASDQRATGSEGGALPDGAAGDAADGGNPDCTAPAPTALLGVATPLMGYTELTPETNAMAGAIASASPVVLDDFDVSFTFSITYKNGTTPGAGLAFFALEAATADLPCQPGPNLCTLGGTAPGFAVILRTSKVNNNDPAVPYVAVVDATTFPTTQPASTVLIDPRKAYTQGAGNGGLPGPATFRQMAIAVRSGKVTASIDGVVALSSVPIPSWATGRARTWGVSSATGQGATFAERTVVGPISLNRCP